MTDAEKVLALAKVLVTCYENLYRDYSAFKQLLEEQI